MKKLRESIAEDRFPAFVQDFFHKLFPNLDSPAWAREALASVGVVLPS